jgi:hypothetical protein
MFLEIFKHILAPLVIISMNALLFLGFLDVMNAKEKYAILLELITG